MSQQYWHCPTCGGNFDPGEKCDCDEGGGRKPMLSISDIFKRALIGRGNPFDYQILCRRDEDVRMHVIKIVRSYKDSLIYESSPRTIPEDVIASMSTKDLELLLQNKIVECLVEVDAMVEGAK